MMLQPDGNEYRVASLVLTPFRVPQLLTRHRHYSRCAAGFGLYVETSRLVSWEIPKRYSDAYLYDTDLSLGNI